MSSSGSAELRSLAERHGVITEYWDFGGRLRLTPGDTLRAILAALGVDASTEAKIAAAQASATLAPWRRMLPPVVVMRHGTWAHVPVHVQAGTTAEVWIELELNPAAGSPGGRWETYPAGGPGETLTVDGTVLARQLVAVPGELPDGYHTLRARAGGKDASCELIVTPATLPLPPSLAQRPALGLQAQLYSVRSRRSWGIGDYADLAALAYLGAARLHADFVLVNPLHAAEPAAPITGSPYLPASRLFLNAQAIRPQDIAEYAYADAATAALVRRQAGQAGRANQDGGVLDRDASWRRKLRALEAIYALPRPPERDEALARFRREGGERLEAFASWCVLREHFAVAPGGAAAATAPVPGAGTPEARAALSTEEAARRAAFHIWCQWIADEQLASAQRAAKAGGMRIGIMHDLAVGTHPAGADVWALGDQLARGITAGAPADYFNPNGQDWSQPPWRPDELARTAYATYRAMLRRAFAHAGALRIDHIIGLFRLWWIPQGMAAADGAYVRYDHEAMIGILLLEAERAGAIVIGEDLGLVEPWVRDYLAERGVLGTSVVWFEREDDGSFPRAPERYRRLSLATVTTHDLPPTAAYLAGEHIAERERLGLIATSPQQARAQAAEEREQVTQMLRERGLVAGQASEGATVAALHRMLRDTPAVLRGISVADLAGERRSQNIPGVEHGYPSWRMPLSGPDGRPVLLEDLFDTPLARELR